MSLAVTIMHATPGNNATAIATVVDRNGREMPGERHVVLPGGEGRETQSKITLNVDEGQSIVIDLGEPNPAMVSSENGKPPMQAPFVALHERHALTIEEELDREARKFGRGLTEQEVAAVQLRHKTKAPVPQNESHSAADNTTLTRRKGG